MTHTLPLRISLVVGAMALGLTAYGDTLGPDEALSRALGRAPRKLAAAAPASSYNLVYTQYMPQTAMAGVYVFNHGNSFVAVSADDCAEALLGYADTTFDPAAIPPAMQWWLGEYAREIEAAAKSGLQPTPTASDDDKAPIAPLLKTEWNQDAPYNDKCPMVNGKRSVTGCVATALAQVMNYHRYPATGQGSVTNTSNGTTLDLSAINFDWDNMADEYVTATTDAQKEAVATLMYAAGMAVNMRYSPVESGATSDAVAPAMINYFNYDKSVFTAFRDYYGISEWNDFVYNQLAEYGPVQYSGVNANRGGHSFVCDGYDKDGYFHINWGWGGMSDGYFKLTALEPGQQGIGGSSMGYNYSQCVVANVGKPREGSTMTVSFNMPSGLELTPLSGIATGGLVTVTSQYANYSVASVTGAPGLKFTASDGSVSYTSTTGLTALIESGQAIYNIRMLTPRLEDGTYKVTPAFMTTNNVWHDVRVQVGGVQSYILTVTNGYMNFTPASLGSITVKDVNIESAIYFSEMFKVSASLTNTGSEEYIGTIQPGLFDSNDKLMAAGEAYSVDLPSGETQPLTYVGSFSQTNTTTAGKYKFAFIDSNTGEILSEPIEVDVQSNPGNTSILIPNFELTGYSSATPEELVFTGTLTCSMGYYGGPVTVYICTMTGNCVEIINSDEAAYFLGAGEEVAFHAKGTFSSGVTGTRYIAIPGFVSSSGQIQPFIKQPYYFTYGVSGIGEIEAADADAEYYNLQGVRVDKPEHGVYIRVSGGNAEKVRF